MKYSISLTLAVLCMVACSKGQSEGLPDPSAEGNDWDIVIPSSRDLEGLGENDGFPQGTPWLLPAGIEVVERPDKPFDSDLGLLHGSMNTFYADINFVNHLQVSVMVEIPGGLVCVFKHEGRTQNGIATSVSRIQVPPTYAEVGTPADTTTIYLGMACINYAKALPWEENQTWDTRDYPIGKDMYQPTVVTSDPNLLKLLTILKDYPKLHLTRHYNPWDAFEPDYETPEWLVIYDRIQQAIWAITDGPGLMRKDYRELMESLKAYK